MSWKTRKKGTRGQRGLKFKDTPIFVTYQGKRIAPSLEDPSTAAGDAKTLLEAFNNAKTRDRKLKLKRALVSLANKAKGAGHGDVAAIYQQTYKAMVLPPKNMPHVKKSPPKMSRQFVEAEAYEAARTRMEKSLASGKSRAEIEKKIDSAITELQLMTVYSTKGGIGGAPDYDKLKAGIRALQRLKADVKAGRIRKTSVGGTKYGSATKKSRSEIAREAAKKAWAKRKEKEKAKTRTYGKPIPKSKPSRNVPLTISHLVGMQLKKDIGFSRAIKRYHNKHKDGSGNFGFTLVDKNGKWFNLSGDYDSTGRIWNLGFGSYSAAPSTLTAKVDGKRPFFTYNSIVNEIKQRARARAPKKITPTVPSVTQLNGHDQYIHQWKVPSKSKPNKTYKVSLHAEGYYLCDCPAFIFQKGPISHRKPCKHIEEVKAKFATRAITQKVPTKVTPITSKKGVYAPPKRWWVYMTEEPHGPQRKPLSPAAAGHLWFKVYGDEKREQIIEDPEGWIEGRR